MLKEATIGEIINSPRTSLGQAYMLVQISAETTIEELWSGEKFFFDIEDDEELLPFMIPVVDAPVIEEEPEEVLEESEKKPVNFPPAEEMKKAVKKKVHKKACSNRVDGGKIIALYKAGWKVAKIADEMRCNPQTVYNHINKWKEEQK